MKKLLIVGNWKMHLNVQQASLLTRRLGEHIKGHRDIEVVLAPSLLALQPLSLEVDRRKFRLCAQNANAIDEGAQTGEVSFTMLRGLVHYSLVGHSERRQHFDDTLEVVRAKVQAAIRNEITPIICVGENRQERQDNETNQVLHDQVTSALANLTAEEVATAVIAYEPIWAIGSGQPAKPAAVAQAVRYIRHVISGLYGDTMAQEVRILYGGSLEPEFVGRFVQLDGIDGLLVGGASLNYQQFSDIVQQAHLQMVKPGLDVG